MKDRLQKLKDLAKIMGNSYLFNELNLLGTEIEILKSEIKKEL